MPQNQGLLSFQKAVLVRIHLTENDRFQQDEAWRVLLKRAREKNLAGCTVLRGAMGFGQSGQVHSEIDMEGTGFRSPYVLEIIDEKQKIDDFLEDCRDIYSTLKFFVSEENVLIQHYGAKDESKRPPIGDAPAGSSNMIRTLNGEHTLLRVFVGESDKIGPNPLYSVLVGQAKNMGLAGATVIRGVAGFGASSVIHSPHLFRLSSDLPMVVEVMDTNERIQAFLTLIRPQLNGALVTEEKVHVHVYDSKH